MVGTATADLEDLNRDAGEVGGRRRRGQVHHHINVAIHHDRFGDVVDHQGEGRVRPQVRHVGFATGDQVVDGDDLVATIDQAITQVRPQKPGAAGDDNAGH